MRCQFPGWELWRPRSREDGAGGFMAWGDGRNADSAVIGGANLAMSADWWRQGTVWKEFSHEQKLMYLKGYSAGFLAGAQQAFKDPEGLNNFYKSLAKITFRQGKVLLTITWRITPINWVNP